MISHLNPSLSSPAPRFVLSEQGCWGGRLFVFSSLPSTNGWMLDSNADLYHGDAVYARHQTRGRGRHRRDWKQPGSGGIALSLLLGEPVSRACYPVAGLVAAVAVHRTLADAGLQAALKWPNDVLVGGRKVCGILCESRGSGSRLITGIGLNDRVPEAALRSDPLLSGAASLHFDPAFRLSRGALIRRLIAGLNQSWNTVLSAGFEPLRRYWRRFDYLLGEPVRIHTGARDLTGICMGMDESGRLLVQVRKRTEAFWSGDVERVRKTGSAGRHVNENGTRASKG